MGRYDLILEQRRGSSTVEINAKNWPRKLWGSPQNRAKTRQNSKASRRVQGFIGTTAVEVAAVLRGYR